MRSRKQSNLGRNKANKENRKKNDDILYFQNVCGIFRREKNGYGRTYIKLEFIIDLVIKNDIKAYLLQEYHDEGNGKTEIKGYTISWHKTAKQEERKEESQSSYHPTMQRQRHGKAQAVLSQSQPQKVNSKEDSLVFSSNSHTSTMQAKSSKANTSAYP